MSARRGYRRRSMSRKVPRLHPHLLRHTYATNFILNGGDAFLLKQNLGHATLTMVEHYLHIAGRRAALASQGFSPLDRFNLGHDRRFSHSAQRRGKRDVPIYPHVGLRSSLRRSPTIATR